MSQEFGAVLAAGLAVMGLVFVASQAEYDFGTESEVESMELFKKSYGTVGEARSDSRSVSLGTFSVGEARGDVLAQRADNILVSSKLLDTREYFFSYNATQPRSGSVEFEVLGKRGTGAVYVKVNGEKIFQEPLVSEATPEITVPATALQSGKNKFVIGTTKGGLLSSSEYRLEDLKVRVNDRKFHDYVDTFEMFDYELRDYRSGTLTFEVGEAVRNEPLNIRVNGEQVFSFQTVRGTQEIEINPQNANLRNGLNEIRFETDGESSYKIQNAALTFRYVGAAQQAVIREQFNLNKTQLDYAERNNTNERLNFRYTNLLGSPRPVQIRLNDYRDVLTPTNGWNSVELQTQNVQETNTLEIKSNGTFEMNNARIISERPGE